MARVKSVGELNGRWALLMKLTLSACPVVAGAAVSLLTWLSYEVLQSKFERQYMNRTITRIAETQDDISATQTSLLIATREIQAKLDDRTP